MSDLDDALTSPAAAVGTPDGEGRRCKVRRILDAVTPEQRDMIIERLHSDSRRTGWSDHVLEAALARGGHRVSHAALSLHRRRLCPCSTFDESEASCPTPTTT